MEAADRQAAKSHLEWRLSNKDITNCVGTFRQVLQGHEEELFQRSLFMFAAVDREEYGDQFCVEEAIRKMATTQPVLDRKRKRDQQQYHDQDVGTMAAGQDLSSRSKKSRRQPLPDFERLVLLIGLAGISQTRVTELGVELYCESQGRANATAQRYATQCIRDKIPDLNMQHLLQFLYHLLGSMVFGLLQDDLCMRASAYILLRKQPTNSQKKDASSSLDDPDTKRLLVDAFQDVVECHARNFTAFQRRHRVRQLEDAVSLAETPRIAQIFYDHLEPNELEAWSQKLHVLGHESSGAQCDTGERQFSDKPNPLHYSTPHFLCARKPGPSQQVLRSGVGKPAFQLTCQFWMNFWGQNQLGSLICLRGLRPDPSAGG